MKCIAISLTAILLSSSIAIADTTDSCTFLNERVKSCEALLDKGDVVIDKQAEAIRLLNDQNARLQKSLDYSIAAQAKAESSNKAWYNDTKVMAPLALTIGIALGAYVAKIATK